MTLTVAEFCRFNLKSRLQLLNKDGELIATRVFSKRIVKIYRIYQFIVEVIIHAANLKVLKAEPALNPGILKLYN